MPCITEYEPTPSAVSNLHTRFEETCREKAALEEMLCHALSIVDQYNPEEKDLKEELDGVDKRLFAWWKKHTDCEIDRVKREALAKLTPRERRALGLK